MRGKQTGDRRSRKHTMFYEEPWDVDPSRVQHAKYIRTYVERMEKEGWRFEQVLCTHTESLPTLSYKRGMLRVYNVDILLSKPIKRFTFEIPEKLLPKLLADPRIGPLIENVSKT